MISLSVPLGCAPVVVTLVSVSLGLVLVAVPPSFSVPLSLALVAVLLGFAFVAVLLGPALVAVPLGYPLTPPLHSPRLALTGVLGYA